MPTNLQSLVIQSEWVLRIIVAILCGCMIGYERTSRSKGAGLRTHAILALGSSLIMIVSKYGFFDMNIGDGSRIAAQVVSGIGFLGAGVIFVKHGTVSGLTTAAGMWVTSGIGLCIGSGLYIIGICSTLFVVGLQTLFHKGFIVKRFQSSLNIHLEIKYRDNIFIEIRDILYDYKAEIHDIKVERFKDIMIVEMEVVVPKEFDYNQLLYDMVKKDYILKLSYV